jgi:HD-GYP domain-containing protein (c-di-GMP phosphodiesterase class II)
MVNILGALSLAGDLGMGRPLEHGVRTAYLSIRLADQLALDDAARGNALYVSLLHGIGCVADAHDMARTFASDEIALKSEAALVDDDDSRALLGMLLRHAGRGRPAWARPMAVLRAMTSANSVFVEGLRAHCEVGDALARRIGLPEGSRRGLLALFERWDGKGINRFAGEQIPLAARIHAVAMTAEVFFSAAGPDAAAEALRAQSGRACEPRLVDAFVDLVADDPRTWSALREPDLAARLGELEPAGTGVVVDKSRLEGIAEAYADFADLKSPFTVGHSRRVAELVVDAGRRIGLRDSELARLRLAALFHDIGRAAIPNTILDKPGPLTDAEWESVRLHPYHVERILSRSTALADLAPLAGAHHERLDGSGYHRGSTAGQLPVAARLLAAADVAAALTEARPHRPAVAPSGAAIVLGTEAREGRLDPRCSEAVIETLLGRPRSLPARGGRLSDREIQVLRLLARGRSTREAATELGITAKTLRHHVEHVYDKLGVSTRPAAVVIALERGLLTDAAIPRSGDAPRPRQASEVQVRGSRRAP